MQLASALRTFWSRSRQVFIGIIEADQSLYAFECSYHLSTACWDHEGNSVNPGLSRFAWASVLLATNPLLRRGLAARNERSLKWRGIVIYWNYIYNLICLLFLLVQAKLLSRRYKNGKAKVRRSLCGNCHSNQGRLPITKIFSK
jgi:hypothetical protein